MSSTQSNIGINISANSSSFVANVNNMTAAIDRLNAKLKDAAAAGNYNEMAGLSVSLHNLEAARMTAVRAQNMQPSPPAVSAPGHSGQSRTAGGAGRMLAHVNTAENYANSALAGAGQGNTGGMLSGIGGLVSKLGGPVVGGAVSALVGAGMLANTAVDAWMQRAPEAMDFYAAHGESRGRLSAAENSQKIRELESMVREARRGTRFSSGDALETANALRNTQDVYGTLAQTEQVLRWQNYTGASRAALVRLMDTEALYGRDTSKAAGAAWNALKISGASEGRFDEFLGGIQSAMEEGIRKGFKTSAQDAAATLAFFSRFSEGNPVWTGEKAAEKLGTINAGFERATALSGTTDMWMYSAARETLQGKSAEGLLGADSGDARYNALMLMEKGITGNLSMLGNYYDTVRKKSNGDAFTEMVTLSKSLGLNYTGAFELRKILNRAAENGGYEGIQEQISKVLENPEYRSEEQEMTSAVNSIRDAVADLGKNGLWIKNGALNGIQSAVDFIASSLGFDGTLRDAERLLGRGEDTGENRRKAEELEQDVNAVLTDETIGYDDPDKQAARRIAGTLNSISKNGAAVIRFQGTQDGKTGMGHVLSGWESGGLSGADAALSGYDTRGLLQGSTLAPTSRDAGYGLGGKNHYLDVLEIALPGFSDSQYAFLFDTVVQKDKSLMESLGDGSLTGEDVATLKQKIRAEWNIYRRNVSGGAAEDVTVEGYFRDILRKLDYSFSGTEEGSNTPVPAGETALSAEAITAAVRQGVAEGFAAAAGEIQTVEVIG